MLETVMSIALGLIAVNDAAWSDRQICQAAIYSYGALNKVPTSLSDQLGGYFLNDSEIGTLSCLVTGDIAIIDWQKNGEQKSSGPITFGIHGDLLIMLSEFGDQGFRLDNGNVIPVNL